MALKLGSMIHPNFDGNERILIILFYISDSQFWERYLIMIKVINNIIRE